MIAIVIAIPLQISTYECEQKETSSFADHLSYCAENVACVSSSSDNVFASLPSAAARLQCSGIRPAVLTGRSSDAAAATRWSSGRARGRGRCAVGGGLAHLAPWFRRGLRAVQSAQMGLAARDALGRQPLLHLVVCSESFHVATARGQRMMVRRRLLAAACIVLTPVVARLYVLYWVVILENMK
eukprot:6942760-Prymnesium_polylepis.1